MSAREEAMRRTADTVPVAPALEWSRMSYLAGFEDGATWQAEQLLRFLQQPEVTAAVAAVLRVHWLSAGGDFIGFPGAVICHCGGAFATWDQGCAHLAGAVLAAIREATR